MAITSAAAAVGVLALFSSSAAPEAAPETARARIVFDRTFPIVPGTVPEPVRDDYDGHSRIYSANADGMEERRLTNETRGLPRWGPRPDDLRPSWSPDGSRIAFVRREPQTVACMRPVTGGPTTCFRDPPHMPDAGSDVYVVRADGSDLHQITKRWPRLEFDDPAWSPRGTSIAVVARDAAGCPGFSPNPPPAADPRRCYFALFVLAADGRALRRVTPRLRHAASPTWSPDGRRIAFATPLGKATEIVIVHLRTGRLRRLTRDGWHDGTPDWSPDGRQILFASERGGGGLYLVDSAGKQVRRLTRPARGDAHYDPSWSPSGRQVVFTCAPTAAGRAASALCLADVPVRGLASPRRLTMPGDNRAPDWVATRG